MLKEKSIKKVLILGSGALKIGEAGEFDYSGSQCIKALKQEKVNTILINPNIATIQTSEHLADKVYFLPVTPEFVEKVIAKEKPDSILLSFGGQTALNCGVELHETGVFKKHKVKVLGTPVQTIINTEDRDLFVKELNKIQVKTPKSLAVRDLAKAKEAAEKIGFPVMLRAAFALGGKGSGVAHNMAELTDLAKKAFSSLPQILVEEYLGGWKEIEYEVVRDADDNCITVCNMENFDPMGIHTGESIVVAPSQTLTNSDYHKLREISIRVIRHLGIIGECNIQYAFDPDSEDYRVIEVNARLSRSSALASKATGYPLAYVAAKLSLGYTLTEISNSITKVTQACFEPALDYIVVKIPRWDLQKFKRVSTKIGSEMKSVGEVMSIARNFPEALQKAVRMLDIGKNGITGNGYNFTDLETSLKQPTDKRLFAVANAFEKGMSVDKVHDLTKIDKWFLYKIKNIVELQHRIKKSGLVPDIIREAKQLGFADKQIAEILKIKETEVRDFRKNNNIMPFVKQIDTLAAEYPAKTNYLYLTYNATEHDIDFKSRNAVIVLGSGSYRIGSSVEFDWCSVNAVMQAKRSGHDTIIINYNPETVSTDYDEADKLYFDELTFERVMDIYELETPKGVIVSVGGQIPNNLALKMHDSGVNVLGTHPKSIDSAENRHKFSELCDSLEIDQPEWKELSNIDDVKEFANNAGYPVLIRPSYVLSGAAMGVVYDEKTLESFLEKASLVSKEYPVVISKFLLNAKEIEIDAVANKGEILVSAISEHIENAGVHSGDANMVLPPQKTYIETIRQIKIISKKLCKALDITGPFNIQFLGHENKLKVIECNLRASRSFPFVSKVMKLNFIELATKAILGEKVKKVEKSSLELDYVGVKSPQFSFTRLRGAFPQLGVEMGSTGEVACLGDDVSEALLKSIISTGFRMPEKAILLSISGDKNRYRLLESVKLLSDMGFVLYATAFTKKFYEGYGIKMNLLYKIHENKEPNVLDYLQNRKVDMVIHIEQPGRTYEHDDPYIIKRTAIDFSITLIQNAQLAKMLVNALYLKPELKIKSWDEY
ncbi:carbamoyl-phosphate synthase (glutamine-hydrolyzing) large subunit [Candidatus Woesearchaeota archaeon]|nr:carbamoyl-phosphate synthase (glutamine-hydrolyzing) large subunit [Candidatus Woesearchaeota archaeon]